jgi:Secretion system C-terminal sorting domain
MRKSLFSIVLFTCLAFNAKAQIISEFTWDSNPVTQAAIGPNGTSVSTFATSSAGGTLVTNGLNPGTGSHDIDLVVPGATFELPGLDVAVDFRKEENGASFFTLGSLDFGISTGAIYAKFLLNKSGVDTMITFNNTVTVPGDGAFHRYRFVYNNTTGIFTASVDGVVGFTYTGTAARPLSWTGATNVTIGSLMDGSGADVAELDSLVVQVPPVVLPLQLLSWDARSVGPINDLDWTTTREVNVSEFVVERSSDGVQFKAIGNRPAQQIYSGNNDYSFIDSLPAPTSFYRLRMIDIDGSFSYSAIKEVNHASAISITCYPNPVINQVNVRIDDPNISSYRYSVITVDGRTLRTGMIEGGGAGQQTSINVAEAPKGILIMRVQGADNGTTAVFKLLKQ